MVTAGETGLKSRRLAQVWRYEGARTLAAYLRRRDCVPALARDLGVPAEAVAATVLRHILEGLTVRAAVPQPTGISLCMNAAGCLPYHAARTCSCASWLGCSVNRLPKCQLPTMWACAGAAWGGRGAPGRKAPQHHFCRGGAALQGPPAA